MSAYKYYEDKDENMGTQTIVGHGTTLSAVEVEPLKTTTTNFVPGLKTKPLIDYKYNEGELIKEIQAYVDATYDQHYSRNKFQATEFIIDGGHGTGFNIGNMMKYTQRYGRKGDPKEWRKDLMKVIHYAIIQLHVHDNEYKD
jgi:hypothetical protein